MIPAPAAVLPTRLRNLVFLRSPSLWPVWPFLPLIRRRPEADDECGVLYDALHACGRPGYSATVFITNLFCIPACVDQFLTGPRETFDTAEEIFDAGWRID